MYSEYEIREIPLSIGVYRKRVEQFLSANGLRLDDVDYYVGVYGLGEEKILAGGGLCGGVIKCVAVEGVAREEGLANRVVSHLVSVAHERGYLSVKLYTKPENRAVFESLSFHLLAEAPKAILMENGDGLYKYKRYLQAERERVEGCGDVECRRDRGVVVMNANPFTRGHHYLLSEASKRVERLYVIVVKEDRSQFKYEERREMIMRGVKGLENVVVLEGSDYAVSEATFPTYFLKKIEEATDTQIALDLDLFVRHIVPVLGVGVRFVGSEPTDALTARYNEMMLQILPKRGVSVEVMERAELREGEPFSGSMVRNMMEAGKLSDVVEYVPKTTLPYVLGHLASGALRQELNATPKPGLVDRHDCGAHSDMNYEVMERSIEVLHPYFVRLSQMGYKAELPSVEEVRKVGMEAESAMLNATRGVNTHRGALFSMGLALIGAAHSLYTDGVEVKKASLKDAIKKLAIQFSEPTGTHGSEVLKRDKTARGALANAQEGYPTLFERWLPALEEWCGEEYGLQKTLLLIMQDVDDTNILYRSDANTLAWVKKECKRLLEDFSIEGVERLNDEFVARNLSPGGAADMLALTLFVRSVLG